jgi:GTP diphosphokinase / guanosine-3',5'-bis(diphosphate) 3'-diphosphatase
MSRENVNTKINKALEFASQIHEGHKRASGEYYYEHTERVYEKLRSVGIKDENTLIASILHQSLDFEETVMSEEINKRFGSEVLNIIKNYRKLSKTTFEQPTPESFNEKYIMQTYINMADDVRTLVIRLADKVDNLETSFALSKEKRIHNALKALHFYSPLARLIGMGKIAIQLENQAFKILKPGEYAHIEKITKRRVLRMQSTIEDLEKLLRSIFDEHKIEARIYHRTKHLYGIFRKASYYVTAGKDPGKNFENIYDILGMRIIVNSVDDCYIVENLLKELMEYLPDSRDDYIRNPRHTGYKSLHNVFKVARGINIEIQIRTYEMHELSEFGPASHLLYKIGDKDTKSNAVDKFKDYLKEKPYWFKDLNYWEAEKALAQYKPNTPFSKYVYAFTPKGDIIQLQKGSNIIDFAYAVHTGLGHSCIGGFVNGQLVKLTHEIKDGDHVEVKTLKSKKKPSADWVDIVKTSKARASIKKALKMN